MEGQAELVAAVHRALGEAGEQVQGEQVEEVKEVKEVKEAEEVEEKVEEPSMVPLLPTSTMASNSSLTPSAGVVGTLDPGIPPVPQYLCQF